jgi:excisionase family DNA binding protein
MAGHGVVMTKLLLTPREAAESLGVGTTKLQELITTGQLESVKIGKARRIPAEALGAYVRELRTQQANGSAA